MALPFFNGCKKGDQDPFLSLRSRDSRLIKTWKLTKLEGTVINSTQWPTDSTTTTNYSFNGTTYKTVTTTTGTSGTNTVDYTGSYSMEIKEDGSVEVEETITAEASSTTITRTSKGSWVWVSGDKKKDHLSISLLSSLVLFRGGLVYVTRLSSKELVLKVSSSNSNTTGSYSNSFSSDFTYSFEKK